MADVLVCVPARRQQPDALWGGVVQCFLANARLRETFDLGADAEADEEAERAALVVASLWALCQDQERFVLTAEVSASQLCEGAEAGNGGASLTGLRREQVTAFFADDPSVDASAAARAAAGLDLDAAWDLPEVAELLGQDLLWHDIGEWGL